MKAGRISASDLTGSSINAAGQIVKRGLALHDCRDAALALRPDLDPQIAEKLVIHRLNVAWEKIGYRIVKISDLDAMSSAHR